MTSTASKALAKGQILPAEGERQHLGHRLRAVGGVDEQVRPAVVPEQLPAPTARHQHIAAEVDTAKRDEPAAAGGVQRGDQPAFGAQPDAVRGVLDVAAGDDPAVVDERRGADRELRVWRVGTAHRLERGPAEPGPVDLGHRRAAAILWRCGEAIWWGGLISFLR